MTRLKCSLDPVAKLRTSCDGLQVLGIQVCDRHAHRRNLLERRYKTLECACSHHEPRRNGDTSALELAEAPALATDVGPVAERDVGEPADVPGRLHHRRMRLARSRVIGGPLQM